MRWFVFLLVLSSLPLLTACTGCSSREKSPDEIRQETANATAKLKQNTVAVAQGIRQGLSKDHVVDLNKASQSDLQSLPGISATQADKIIAARPFDNPDQLVTRRIVTQAEYDQISKRVTVTK
jgi:DNA uptake protein ComE-like DNA-binding protein